MMSPLQEFTFYRTYARFINRKRENFDEAIERLKKFLVGKFGESLDLDIACEHFRRFEAFPSMRLFSTAGAAADKDNAAVYNCAYMQFKKASHFGDLMYLLMCGCGVGFTVEREAINDLVINRGSGEMILQVPDSREGWHSAITALMKHYLSEGVYPKFDYSLIRPKGARLNTFGGRASGHEVLKVCLESVDNLLRCKASGERLTSVEVFDISCFIAQCVLAGGSRRSATIALFDCDDVNMLNSKSPEEFAKNPHRSAGNISAVIYDNTPDEIIRDILTKAMTTGEPGLVNRSSLWRKLDEHKREFDDFVGVNPCGEIVLRPYQFCNLSEINLSRGNPLKSLASALYFGMAQASFTKFSPLLDPLWKKRTEEDRLLGISLTGITDSNFIPVHTLKQILKGYLKKASKTWGFEPKAVTTIKPSGTVGLFAGCSQGIHPRLGRYTQRSIRLAAYDPLARLLLEQNHPHIIADNGDPIFQFLENHANYRPYSAHEQLNLREQYEYEWCDHQPSQTIYIQDSEFNSVLERLIASKNELTGLTFFNIDRLAELEKMYSYLPIQVLSTEKAIELGNKIHEIDFSKLVNYESEDNTERVIACSGGTSCSL